VTPRVDVVETEDNIEVTAELPGIAEADIDVSVAEGMVTIRGEKKIARDEKKGDLQLSERSFGSFARSFRMPENVDEDHITATFDKGVLSLSMPKKEKVQPQRKKIEVHTKH
jgi:HSP20 family protein